jgi:DNA-binding CsgD family transcriptional regulator
MPFSSHQKRAIDQLSPGQMAVLQRVAEHKSSKEIARELGISPHTVDQRVKRIHAILGVGSRAEAARLYLAADAPIDTASIYQEQVYQRPDLSHEWEQGKKAASLAERNPESGRAGMLLRENQAAYFADGFFPANSSHSWTSVLFEVHRENALGPVARSMAILLIMLLTLFALSALVGLAEGLSRIL